VLADGLWLFPTNGGNLSLPGIEQNENGLIGRSMLQASIVEVRI